MFPLAFTGSGITVLNLETAAMGGQYRCCVNPQAPKETALRNSSRASTRPWLREATEFLTHLVLGSDMCSDSPSLKPLPRAPLHTAAAGSSARKTVLGRDPRLDEVMVPRLQPPQLLCTLQRKQETPEHAWSV